jgi:hypothetical protein
MSKKNGGERRHRQEKARRRRLRETFGHQASTGCNHIWQHIGYSERTGKKLYRCAYCGASR